MKVKKKTIGLVIYLGLLLMPIYWMLNMSLRTNADILANFALYPVDMTLTNYIKIFTQATQFFAWEMWVKPICKLPSTKLRIFKFFF